MYLVTVVWWPWGSKHNSITEIQEHYRKQNITEHNIKSNINTTKLYKHNIIENTIYEKQYCRNDNNIIEKNTKMA